MNARISQSLGLAMRARKLITGEELVVAAVRTGQAKLVILALDASTNTAKKITDKCHFYQVPCHAVADRYELGKAIGKESRVVVAVTDAKMADNIQHLLTPN